MKRTVALVVALLMALAVLPAMSFAAPADQSRHDGADHDPVAFSVTNMDYTSVTSVEDGGTGLHGTTAQRYFYYDITEGSGMYAHQFLIDYPEAFVSITNATVTWSGGVIAQVNAGWDDGEPDSDTLNVVYNYPYEGQTGGVPVGEAGNMYINGGSYETSYEFMGLQTGGHLARFQLRLDKTPFQSECEQDANGYYLPLGLFINEFEFATINPDTGNYTASDNYAQPEYAEWLTATGGKVYVNAKEDPVEPTEPSGDHDPVNFYVTDMHYETVTAVDQGGTGLHSTTAQRYFYYGITEGSGMYAHQFLIDYPEAFVSITNATVTWSGGVIAQVNATWDDGEPTSDTLNVVYNYPYEGQTGGVPVGEAGNMYINGGSYETSYQFMGLQAGGYLARFTLKLDVAPTVSQCLQDEVGYYLPLGLFINEFEYAVINPETGNYTASENYAQPEYAEWLSSTDGKLYVTPIEDPTPTPDVTDVPVYNIVFTINGQTYQTYTLEYGAAIVIPEYTAETGWTFSGWTNVPETALADGTYDATLTQNEYTVTYVVNGETVGTQTYHYGDAIVPMDYTAPDGYTFDGWNDVPANMPAEDITITGTITPIPTEEPTPEPTEAPTPVPNYTITILYQRYSDALEDWVALENPTTITLPYGSDYDVNDQIPETIGEYALVEVIGAVTGTLTENVTIEAHYAIPVVPEHTVTYYLNNEFYAEQTYQEGAAITAPVVDVPAGWTFSGWDVPEVMGTEDIVVYATLTHNVWTLTIRYQYADDTIINEVTYQVPAGEHYHYEVEPIEGYTAYPDVVDGDMPDSDWLVVVVYSQTVMYTVTFQFVDEVYFNEGQIVPVAEPITVTGPAGTEISGYTYPVVEGYSYEHQGEEIPYTITGNNTVLVYYSPNSYTLTIHYVLADGTPVAEDYVAEILYNRPYDVASPVIEGYTPDHANVEGQMPAEDVEVTVVYSPKTYQVAVYYLNAETEMALIAGNFFNAEYNEVINVEPAVIDGWTCINPEAGQNILITGNTEIEFLYVQNYEPVPPTVAATEAEIRTRANNDSLKDLRFIMTVTFNDSYVTYGNTNYGPTELYYKIVKFWTVLSTGSAEVTVNGNNIYAMYDETFTYTAVLKGIKESAFDTVITATPWLTYTMGGVSTTVSGPAIESSVNMALN